MGWNLKDLQETLLIGSTLVEGSTLSEKEAREILSGKTVAGHPVSEAREILNYRAAVEWIMKELKKSPFLSQDLILGFHAKLFQGFPGEHGRFKASRNFTYLSDGSRYDYEAPGRVEPLIRKWLERFQGEHDPISVDEGAWLYHEFQRIHPFDDGNGRIGRILIAYWFHWKMKKGFSFFLRDKVEHLQALERASAGDLVPLRQFFKKRLK
jgi:Fic family protein